MKPRDDRPAGDAERDGQFELLVTNRVLLSLFALCIVAFGLFFAAGYLFARWSEKQQAAGPAPAAPAAQPPVETPPRVPLEMEFVPILPGKFIMGFRRGWDDGLFEQISESAAYRANSPEESWFPDLRKELIRDCPPHRVRLTRPFELSRYEVSIGQWNAIMRSRDITDSSSDYPVSNVTWNDVQEFLQHMNSRRDGYRYRLPTEAEWEYAARARTTGEATGEMYRDAWDFLPGDRGISARRPVDIDTPNAWGLYNMLGNVSEWVADWYGKRYYRTSPREDPTGPRSGKLRVVRGGNSHDVSFTAFVWSRSSYFPTEGATEIGFRCAREKVD